MALWCLFMAAMAQFFNILVTLFTLYVITMMCEYSYIRPIGNNFMSFCSR